MSEYGELLKRLRAKRQMSLQDLADKAGCTKPHIWEMENGHSCNPTIGTLSSLARALGVPLSRLTKPWAETTETD
jgi:transcriptional regulator with XRE-family HTH domain